ncbi:unnamed protein product [Blepharisma stoltei]|uniref:ATP synthase mitochondrial F1 complex assembly factor 1 n=1 Tax=Blepharisma stoltei TaxID=1481888 RepID=A0AAU9JBH7_9CILI|nr:unnamed protein product [Blepharisma stoltei]
MIVKRLFAFISPFPKTLEEVAKVNLLQNQDPKAVASIWNEYHAVRPNCTSMVLANLYYTHFSIRALKHPLFIFPIRRRGNIFFLTARYVDKLGLFYYLPDYEAQHENATASFGLSFYDELTISKEIILIRGDINDRLISKTEADVIMSAYLAHYLEDELYEKYIVTFNDKADQFDHGKFLESYFARFVPRY